MDSATSVLTNGRTIQESLTYGARHSSPVQQDAVVPSGLVASIARIHSQPGQNPSCSGRRLDGAGSLSTSRHVPHVQRGAPQALTPQAPHDSVTSRSLPLVPADVIVPKATGGDGEAAQEVAATRETFEKRRASLNEALVRRVSSTPVSHAAAPRSFKVSPPAAEGRTHAPLGLPPTAKCELLQQVAAHNASTPASPAPMHSNPARVAAKPRDATSGVTAPSMALCTTASRRDTNELTCTTVESDEPSFAERRRVIAQMHAGMIQQREIQAGSKIERAEPPKGHPGGQREAGSGVLSGVVTKAAEMAGIEPISNPAAPVTVQVHDLPHTTQPPASSRQIETPIDWMLLREENPTI